MLGLYSVQAYERLSHFPLGLAIRRYRSTAVASPTEKKYLINNLQACFVPLTLLSHTMERRY